jgi:hypothetical protein
MIMKSFFQAVAIAAVLAAPVTSFAQSNPTITRAQVRAELVQVEQAGYSPSHGRDPYYPSDIQAAQARVASQNGGAQAAATGFGPGASGTSQTGQRAEVRASSYSPPVYVIGR